MGPPNQDNETLTEERHAPRRIVMFMLCVLLVHVVYAPRENVLISLCLLCFQLVYAPRGKVTSIGKRSSRAKEASRLKKAKPAVARTAP